VKFVGVFVVDPRFFKVCASGYICSGWIDLLAPGFGSMNQTITLQRTMVPVSRLSEDRP